MNGVSYDGLDDDILERMVRAGFTHLNLSLVSSSERTRGRMNRPHALARFSAVTSRASALGLKMVAYQILGLPGETLEEMIETMAFLARLPVVLGPSLFYMTPGSDLARGFPPPTRSDYILARGTAMAVETGQFQRDDLYTLFLSTRIINFLKRMEATGDLSLPEALIQARQAGPRMALGAEILERLRTEKRLFAALKNGWAPLERFRTGLFERLWSAIGRVRLPSGGWIHLA
jgi:radical SAM superfamily enzyme YgiQ (UPF0313 family)